jgi:cytochrome P450
MTRNDDGAVVFRDNPFTKQWVFDPETLQEKLREAGAVVWLETHDCYAVARYQEVQTVTQDWGTYSSASGTGLANYSKVKPWRDPAIVLEADPPRHARGRTVFTRALSPKRIRDLREPFQAYADTLVDAALKKVVVDGVAEIAQAFTLKVFPDAVGMPSVDRHRFLEYGDMQLHSFVPPDWLDHDPYENHAEVADWVLNNCKREAIVGDGFGAVIYEAVDAGEITEAEGQNLVRSFLAAGVDNSISSFGNALWCYATYPDQWEKLRTNPGLLRNAYEEVLRFRGPLQFNFRTTTKETELSGVRLRENEKVCVFIASANRDPRHWPEAGRFDIERKATGHMAFGTGIHGCVGQVLARLEGEALFSALLKRVRAFELAGEPAPRLVNVVQSFERLPIRLIPN